MDITLLYIVVALGISTILNLFLKKLGVSQIIGYIFTGTIIVICNSFFKGYRDILCIDKTPLPLWL